MARKNKRRNEIRRCPVCHARQWEAPPVLWFYGVVRCGCCGYEAPKHDLPRPVEEATSG